MLLDRLVFMELVFMQAIGVFGAIKCQIYKMENLTYLKRSKMLQASTVHILLRPRAT